MNNYSGFEPQDHTHLQIQGRIAGLIPSDWVAVWNAADSADVVSASAKLNEYRQGRRRLPLCLEGGRPLEYRLVRITVRQTVTTEVVDEQEVTA